MKNNGKLCIVRWWLYLGSYGYKVLVNGNHTVIMYHNLVFWLPETPSVCEQFGFSIVVIIRQWHVYLLVARDREWLGRGSTTDERVPDGHKRTYWKPHWGSVAQAESPSYYWTLRGRVCWSDPDGQWRTCWCRGRIHSAGRIAILKRDTIWAGELVGDHKQSRYGSTRDLVKLLGCSQVEQCIMEQCATHSIHI